MRTIFYGLLMMVFGINTVLYADFYVIPFQKKIKNVITVAKAGGNFTDLQQAVDSVEGASPSNPYVIYIAPGTYTLSETLVMDHDIHLVGSGKDSTFISGEISDASLTYGAVIVCNRTNSLQSLSIKNYAALNNNISVGVKGEPFMKHVGVLMTSRSHENYAIHVNGFSDLEDVDIVMSASYNGHESYGIYLEPSAAKHGANIRNVRINMSGEGRYYAIYSDGASPFVDSVQIRGDADISYGTPSHLYGYYGTNGADASILNSYIELKEGTAFNDAIVAQSNTHVTLRRSSVQVSGPEGSFSRVFMAVEAGSSITASQSTLIGDIPASNNHTCLQSDDSVAELDTNCN